MMFLQSAGLPAALRNPLTYVGHRVGHDTILMFRNSDIKRNVKDSKEVNLSLLKSDGVYLI